MYRTILLILYLTVLITSANHMIRYRENPSSRRLSAGLGIGLLLLIFVGGIVLIVKSFFT